MRRYPILALATLVSVAAGTGAVASPDLSKRRPVPQDGGESVPCPAFGPGFVRLPGSETCIKVGGRVAVEYGTAPQFERKSIGGGAGARLDLESRTQTEYGPFRAVVQVKGRGP